MESDVTVRDLAIPSIRTDGSTTAAELTDNHLRNDRYGPIENEQNVIVSQKIVCVSQKIERVLG
jgi:hypothetical protein